MQQVMRANADWKDLSPLEGVFMAYVKAHALRWMDEQQKMPEFNRLYASKLN
jgi:hypothetical protein